MGIEIACTILPDQPYTRLAANGWLKTTASPGQAWWKKWYGSEEYAGLAFSCPCGCGYVGMFRLGRDGKKGVWDWDGNKLAPTFTPSMQVSFECRWHGYLTAGIFRKC